MKRNVYVIFNCNFVHFTADFSNIVEDPEQSNSIYFDKILHKAILEVNERGTEAAAASSSTFDVLSSAGPKITYKFDRPFLYAVMDKQYMFPLFVGRVVDPSDRHKLSLRASQDMPNEMTSEHEMDQDHMKSMDEIQKKPEMAKAAQTPAEEDVESMEKVMEEKN